MDNDAIAMLTLYHDEWKYRHENFWKRLIQFTIVIFFTTTLPITFRVFGGLILPNISLLIFPICGIVLIPIFLAFCLSENSRLIATSNTIEKICKGISSGKYVKSELPSPKNKTLKYLAQNVPFLKWRIGAWIPIAISIIQLALSLFVIYLIVSGKLSSELPVAPPT